ncbi:MAG: ATP-binding cassette domain-containing protein [Armatimonadetes bacterium]|nr:ATP-binding cassette domain-containing protein [Armatimonadota bacterium]
MLGAVKSLFVRRNKEVLAADRINVSVDGGELVGFLGPNGAGKTTTLKMLSGILHPTSGRAEVLGYRPWERRPEFQKQFSLVMGQKNQLWWDLPAEESFLLLKELYEIPQSDYQKRVREMTKMLEIDHLLSTQVRKLSLGERMKCELVAALLHRPRVVFLDEPTIGLDVVSQKRIREFIALTNRQEGATFILTSHYMDDVRALCERVVIIDHGRVIFDDALSRLVTQFTHTKQLRLTFSVPVEDSEISCFGKLTQREALSAAVEIPRELAPKVAAEMLARLPVVDIEITDPDVEDVIRDIFQRKETAPTVAQEEAV